MATLSSNFSVLKTIIKNAGVGIFKIHQANCWKHRGYIKVEVKRPKKA
jgi:predicted transcriptional regulator